MDLFRLEPRIVYDRYSAKSYDRTGAPRRIVLHSTEGHNIPHSIRDISGVIDYLWQASVRASINVVTDGDGHSGRMIPDDRDAWHVAAYNPNSLGIEQIGLASEGRKAWRKRWRQLREDARWIARWSLRYEIPIRHSTDHGVCKHADLGAAGGGHWDPGDYPLRRVLLLARLYKRALKRRRRR